MVPARHLNNVHLPYGSSELGASLENDFNSEEKPEVA